MMIICKVIKGALELEFSFLILSYPCFVKSFDKVLLT